MKPVTGHRISQLIEETEGPILVVAPYITRPAFQHLISLLGDRALAVVTEWSVRSVAVGATDPRIYHDVAERHAHYSTQLSLLPGLHGKLYVSGHRALVGSANLTGNGTGWFGPGNLELLVEVSADNPDVTAFISAVKQYRTEATAAKADAVRFAAKEYRMADPEVRDSSTPMLRSHPKEFVRQYFSGGPRTRPVTQDAKTLSVPEGLDSEQLVRHLQTFLRALAFLDLATTVSRRTAGTGDPYQQQEEFLQTARTYGLEQPPRPDDAGHYWTILTQWMNHLFPNEFSTLSTGPQLLVSTAGNF